MNSSMPKEVSANSVWGNRLAAFEELIPASRVWQLVWGFVILGILARATRFLLCFPLWEDECFLCYNLMDRSFVELLQPLQFHQVSAVLFLWVQALAVKVLGFSEFSLRLFPFACGVGSLLLFRYFAGRFLQGTALVLAVATFAVSYAGIRYSAEAKPYSVDLFVSLGLLYLCVLACQSLQTKWVWALCAAVPIAVSLSYPSVFIGGGISLTMGYVFWTSKQPSKWLPWVLYNFLLTGSFLGLFLLMGNTQSDAELGYMQEYWGHTFPPLTSLSDFVIWFVVTHTSNLVAYPVGSSNGASSLTAIGIVIAIAIALRERRYALLLLCLAPLGLSLVAAGLQRYPYGGHIRFQLYMMPIFCLLAGLGWSSWLAWFGNLRLGISTARLKPLSTSIVLAILCLVAVGSMGRDWAMPYKTQSDQRARGFARWFWFNMDHEYEVASLEADLKQQFSPQMFEHLNWYAMHACNRKIYSPRHHAGRPLDLSKVSSERPLCVVQYRCYQSKFDRPAFEAWLYSFQTEYNLVSQQTFPFPRYAKGERLRLGTDYVDVYVFEPKHGVAAPVLEARRDRPAGRN